MKTICLAKYQDVCNLKKYSLKQSYSEIKPVPRITKEIKRSYPDASCSKFYKYFKCVNSKQSIPAEKFSHMH